MNDNVYLLWTGGYDSTFRLLQLLLIEKKKVQPIYVIDLEYRSPIYELLSMNEIRQALNQRGGVGELLQPTRYIDKNKIIHDGQILEAWSRIKQKRHIGRQYVWLASLCKQYDLSEVELSIESRDLEEKVDHSLAYNLHKSRITADERTVFNYFSFPILQLTKKKMQKIVEREGWTDLMGRTWFCHHPIYHPLKKGIPCGLCNPCRIAVEEGFGHKIPFVLRHSGKYLKKMYNSSLLNLFR